MRAPPCLSFAVFVLAAVLTATAANSGCARAARHPAPSPPQQPYRLTLAPGERLRVEIVPLANDRVIKAVLIDLGPTASNAPSARLRGLGEVRSDDAVLSMEILPLSFWGTHTVELRCYQTNAPRPERHVMWTLAEIRATDASPRTVRLEARVGHRPHAVVYVTRIPPALGGVEPKPEPAPALDGPGHRQ